MLQHTVATGVSFGKLVKNALLTVFSLLTILNTNAIKFY